MPGMSADRSVCAPKKGGRVKGLKGIHLEFPTLSSEFPTYQPMLFLPFIFLPNFVAAEFLTVEMCPKQGGKALCALIYWA